MWTFPREGYILPAPVLPEKVLLRGFFFFFFTLAPVVWNVWGLKNASNLDWTNISVPDMWSKGVVPNCPIEVTPNRMVVRYQSLGQPANCTSATKGKGSIQSIYWKDQYGNKTDGPSWSVHTYNSWDLKPRCVAEFQHGSQTCEKELSIIVYSKFCLFALCGYPSWRPGFHF